MIRTDLAIEAHEFLLESAQEISGVLSEETEKDDIKITTVKIETDEAQKRLGKPKGKYITIEMPDIMSAEREEYEKMCHALASELRPLLNLKKGESVLVVGLGNWNITPDSLGPDVLSRLMVTRHLFCYIPDQMSDSLRPVSAISPGVLGITGVETGEIIKGVCEKIKPDRVLAIDALASRSVNRISSTIQLCDTGISPGAGVGNKRKELSEKTLGVPVIAIGVPTVIDAATIAHDSFLSSIRNVLKETDNNTEKYKAFYSFLENDGENLSGYLPEDIGGFIVTPKDVDTMIEKTAKIIANGINLALHEDIGFDDINAFLG